jgi:hypothetical protein
LNCLIQFHAENLNRDLTATINIKETAMPGYLRSALFIGATLLPFAACVPATAAENVRVVMGTATPGGGFPVFGDAVVRTVAKTDPNLVIEARNTKGSTENIPLLEAGTLDIALVQGEADTKPCRVWGDRQPISRSSQRRIPHPACSSCALIVRTTASVTCAARRWHSALAARAL